MADIDGRVSFCVKDGTPSDWVNHGAFCPTCGGTEFLPLEAFIAQMFTRLRILETLKSIPAAASGPGRKEREITVDEEVNELARTIREKPGRDKRK
jgi:hypothetical protein